MTKRRYVRSVIVPGGKACSIYLGPEDRETLHELGGSAWIREQLAKARRALEKEEEEEGEITLLLKDMEDE